MRLRTISEDKMSSINMQDALQSKPQEWIQAINRFPEILQREILEERPNPTQEDINWVKSWKVGNKPVVKNMKDLLKNSENLTSISRSPQDVVQEINQKWGLKTQPGQVYDPTPERYQQYAKNFTGKTAKPSVLVNGEIVFGTGRFIAALLRGENQLTVWDVTTPNNYDDYYN
jgi:hypothetical protein